MEKRRAILIGLVCLVLLNLAFSSVAQASPAVVSVSPSSIEVSQGQTFTIDITVDPKGAEVFGAQYDLYFDTNMLKAVSQTPGTFLSQDDTKTNVFVNETNNTLGKVKYVESRMGVESGVTSPGILASISFEAIAASGKSNLILSTVKLSDINGKGIETETNDGTCTIGNVTAEPAFTDIKVEDAHEMMEANPEEFILLDVRTEEEYNAEHISMPGVELKSIPKDELENRLDEVDKTKKIVVYCETGVDSRTASELLVQNGFEHVYNMLGGIEAWRINFRENIIKATPSPAAPSPSPAASPIISPTPIATPTPTPTIGGFEAVFAMTMLAISYLFFKKGRSNRNE
jgi:rhodanese-related sulfurtransferase